jgi:SAM-dependent methyltransferase
MSFDADAYRSSTRDQWQATAAAWDAWGPTIESWLGFATSVMLDLARVQAGGRVLDVAAGTGGQTIAAARRVGPDGHVLATDISSAILALARRNACAAGLGNVTTQEVGGEELDVEPAAFDAVISRLGLIYFPDRARALAGIHRALRPGGRLATVVYSTAAANAFFSIPVAVLRERAGLAPPQPGAPGPFCLGAPGVAEGTLREAGFTDVVAVRLDAPLLLPSAAVCLKFEQESFGALHQMLSGLPPSEQVAVWAEVGERLREHVGPDVYVGQCELIVVVGAAP